MSDLINKIKAAQMMAGEQEVINHLKESGLLPTPPATVIQPLQWVKASERLPQKDGQFYCKTTNENCLLDFFWEQQQFGFSENGAWKSVFVSEWLDESTPTNQPKEISDELSGREVEERIKEMIITAFDDGKKYGYGTPLKFKGGNDYYEKNKTAKVFQLKAGYAASPQLSRREVERVCQNCNGKNPTWYADNELFNKVNGSPNGIICPSCFEKKAEEMGINIIFKAGYTGEGEEAIGVLDWIVENKWVGEFDDFCGYMWYQITESGTSNYINSNQLANLYKLSKK